MGNTAAPWMGSISATTAVAPAAALVLVATTLAVVYRCAACRAKSQPQPRTQPQPPPQTQPQPQPQSEQPQSQSQQQPQSSSSSPSPQPQPPPAQRPAGGTQRREAKEWVVVGGDEKAAVGPVSVNYHFSRVCNYSCKFCFHTRKTSFITPTDEVLRGLRLLKEAGMKKINFAGGEPFLYPDLLGEMVRFCKEELGVNVSIVSNASKITEDWFQVYSRYLDILAVSIDSFDEATNVELGRHARNINHCEAVQNAQQLCAKYGVKFKINTVVTTKTVDEDMTEGIRALNPFRWKVFQCLLIEGENIGPRAKRMAQDLVVSDEKFQAFLQRNALPCLVPEDNAAMKDSYVILDEKMRFLNCTQGRKDPSASLLEVGVARAFAASGFDAVAFDQRGGRYDWSRSDVDNSDSKSGSGGGGGGGDDAGEGAMIVDEDLRGVVMDNGGPPPSPARVRRPRTDRKGDGGGGSGGGGCESKGRGGDGGDCEGGATDW